MFDLNQRQFLTGDDIASAITALSGAAYTFGVPLGQTGPNSWAGRGNMGSFGMVPKIAITVVPAQGGLFLDLRISPDFEGSGLILFIVAWLVFFPVALVLGFLGYQDFQTRQQQISQALWGSVAQRLAAPPGAGGFGPPTGYGPTP